jgi:lipoprotein-anchoring transpeptidase ErfK/SrfK
MTMTDRHTGATALTRRGFARLGVSAAAALVAATATVGIAVAAPTVPTTPTVDPTPTQEAPPVATKTGWVALADDATKQITIWHNGEVVRTMPTSMGSNRFPTPNGTYYTMEKKRDMYMDSSTYGVPVNSPDGYRTYVEYATRMSWSGIFVHAAPWSVKQQGVSNVSHGCLNVSTENGKYIYDNFPIGTPIVVRGTVGGSYTAGS